MPEQDGIEGCDVCDKGPRVPWEDYAFLACVAVVVGILVGRRRYRG